MATSGRGRRPGHRFACPGYTWTSALLNPELIHAGEGGGIFRFEGLPGGKVCHGVVVGKAKPIARKDRRRKLETDELQIVLVEKGSDLRNGQMVLLDVEQEVAAFVEAEVVGVLSDRSHR